MLKLEKVSVSYGSINALVDIDIVVPEGKVVALIGANGSGKSTLLKSISGLVPMKQGKMQFDNTDISNIRIEKRAKMGIAHVLEGRRIFRNLTIEENLRLAMQFRQKLSQKERNRLIGEVYEKFKLLSERKNELAGGLSGGQLQILIFAVATICKPKVLLLDEPSLGLAPLMVKQVYEIVNSLNQEGVTILLAEQLATFALEVSDYAYVLDKGKIIESGESAYLKKELGKEGLAKAYLG